MKEWGVIYVPKGASYPMNDADWMSPPKRELSYEELWVQRLLLGPGVQRPRSAEGTWFTVCAVVLAIWTAMVWTGLG